jgi:nucleoside-diphosphate-sugar epimerase
MVNDMLRAKLLEVARACFRFKTLCMPPPRPSMACPNPQKFREDEDCDKAVSSYAATKRLVELLAHSYSASYNLNVTGLRFFTVFGPRSASTRTLSICGPRLAG